MPQQLPDVTCFGINDGINDGIKTVSKMWPKVCQSVPL